MTGFLLKEVIKIFTDVLRGSIELLLIIARQWHGIPAFKAESWPGKLCGHSHLLFKVWYTANGLVVGMSASLGCCTGANSK